jgi:hypothetical protein
VVTAVGIRFVSDHRLNNYFVAIGVVSFFFVHVCYFIPLTDRWTYAACPSSCFSSLRQISIALHDYEKDHGHFPPAFLSDKVGKPIHSWRVLLTPQLNGNEASLKRYNFDEPWNGPTNKELWGWGPLAYSCPCDMSRWPLTSYIAIVGAQTAWPGDKGVSLNEIESRGRPEDTVLIIENNGSNVSWNEPRDFAVDDFDNAAVSTNESVVRSAHSQDNGYFYHETPLGPRAIFADGSLHGIRASSLTKGRVKELFAIGGCKDADKEPFEGSGDRPPLNWRHVIGLPVWLVSTGLLFFLAWRGRVRLKTRGEGLQSGDVGIRKRGEGRDSEAISQRLRVKDARGNCPLHFLRHLAILPCLPVLSAVPPPLILTRWRPRAIFLGEIGRVPPGVPAIGAYSQAAFARTVS